MGCELSLFLLCFMFVTEKSWQTSSFLIQNSQWSLNSRSSYQFGLTSISRFKTEIQLIPEKAYKNIETGTRTISTSSNNDNTLAAQRQFLLGEKEIVVSCTVSTFANPTSTRLVPPLTWLTSSGSRVKILHSMAKQTSTSSSSSSSSPSDSDYISNNNNISRNQTSIVKDLKTKQESKNNVVKSSILEISVSRSMIDKSLSLLRMNGFKKEDIYRMLDKGPWILAFDISHSLPKLFSDLQKDLQLTSSQAVHVVSHCPYLLAQYCQFKGRDVSATARALLEVGYSSTRLVDDIMRFPTILASPPDRIKGWMSLLQIYGIGMMPGTYGKMLKRAPFMFYIDPPLLFDLDSIGNSQCSYDNDNNGDINSNNNGYGYTDKQSNNNSKNNNNNEYKYNEDGSIRKPANNIRYDSIDELETYINSLNDDNSENKSNRNSNMNYNNQYAFSKKNNNNNDNYNNNKESINNSNNNNRNIDSNKYSNNNRNEIITENPTAEAKHISDSYIFEDVVCVLNTIQSFQIADIDKVVRTQPNILLESEMEVRSRLNFLYNLFVNPRVPIVPIIPSPTLSTTSTSATSNINTKSLPFNSRSSSNNGSRRSSSTSSNNNYNYVNGVSSSATTTMTLSNTQSRQQKSTSISSTATINNNNNNNNDINSDDATLSSEKSVLSNLNSLLLAYPMVLSIPHRNLVAVSTLLQSMGFRRQEVVQLVRKYPSIFHVDAYDVQLVISFLRYYCNFRKYELVSFLLKHPSILESTVSELNIKLDYLTETMNGTSDLLQKTPAYFHFSFDEHIRLRAEFLQAMGYQPLHFGLEFLLFSIPQEFAKKLNIDIDLFEKFKIAYFECAKLKDCESSSFYSSSSTSTSTSSNGRNNNSSRRNNNRNGNGNNGRNSNTNNRAGGNTRTSTKNNTNNRQQTVTATSPDYSNDESSNNATDIDNADDENNDNGDTTTDNNYKNSNNNKNDTNNNATRNRSEYSWTDPNNSSNNNFGFGRPVVSSQKAIAAKQKQMAEDAYVTVYDSSNTAVSGKTSSLDILFELNEDSF